MSPRQVAGDQQLARAVPIGRCLDRHELVAGSSTRPFVRSAVIGDGLDALLPQFLRRPQAAATHAFRSGVKAVSYPRPLVDVGRL